MRVLFLSLVIVWSVVGLAQGQLTPQEIVLVGSAMLGATAGGFAVGSFEFFHLFLGNCSGSVSYQVLEERYGHDLLSRLTKISHLLIGPALGATVSLALTGRLYGLEGQLGWSALYSFVFLGSGLSMGCVFAIPVLEPFLSTLWPVQWAALGAIFGYRPVKKELVLWELRF